MKNKIKLIFLSSTISAGDEKLAELDVSMWSDAHKQSFVTVCLQEYVRIQADLDADQAQVVWKTFQTFLIEKLMVAKSRFRPAKWRAAVKAAANAESLAIKWRE